MKRIAISELEGVALDWAVAKAIGLPLIGAKLNTFDENHLSMPARYSADWSQCGPLIERYGLTVRPHCTANDVVTSWCADYVWPITRDCPSHCGLTPLIAACRAIVASHNPSGYVEVPDELLHPDNNS